MEDATQAPKPFTILMAEDDVDDQNLVINTFRRVHLRNPLEIVNDGEQLLDYLNRQGAYTSLKGQPLPGLILLDLNMPRKDGREALQVIKTDEKLKSIPVVILTTSQTDDDLIQSYDLGVNSFLTKPVTLSGLMQVISVIADYRAQILTA